MTNPPHPEPDQGAADLARLYRTAVEQATEGIAVLQDGQLKFANPSVAGIVGMTVDQFQGLSFAQVFHPDDVPFVAAQHEQRMRGSTTPQTHEFRVVRPMVACAGSGSTAPPATGAAARPRSA